MGRALLVQYRYLEVVKKLMLVLVSKEHRSWELAEALRQEYVTRQWSHVGLIGAATMRRETRDPGRE